MKNKKKCLLVVDNENWAFYNISINFQKYLKKLYDIDIISMETLNYNVVDLFLFANDYDLIHLFWRGFILDLDNDFSEKYIYNLGLSKQEFIQKYVSCKKITTCVYDHKMLNENTINKYLKYISDYYVSSNILKNEYEKLNLVKQPSMVITDGVDLESYTPKKDKYKNIKNRKIYIGWAGNSKWDGEFDHKGVNTIIKPAIQELEKEGYNIELHLADSSVKMRNKDEMKKYYEEIDLYLCCSVNEGTPNPILESFACGIPVISTNVGIVEQLFGEKQKKYILSERSKDELKNKIIYFIENIDKIKELSSENLVNIKNWTWENKSKDFKKFLEKNIF